MFLQSKKQETAENIFATANADLDPELESMDPSERLEFSRPSKIGINRFDTRSDDELKDVAFQHILSMERERAVWEYADRNKVRALPLLKQVARQDSDPSIRWSTLWAIQKFGGIQSKEVIGESLKDEHPEVRDWAHLLLREITGTGEGEPDSRKAKIDESNPFDQTLPLLIAGYARVLVPTMGFVQATLSPQWFESIMGRVMACTREETFNTDLVIEKKISGYHPDGTDHLEIYKFYGFTQEISTNVCDHQYQCEACHTFYPSGKVEDVSVPPLNDVVARLERRARTLRVELKEFPGRKIVQSVRGRYMGVAYVDLNRIFENKMNIGPGEVQLSNLSHPIVGTMTNTLLFGTFKGKLSDIDGDGYLDVNTEPCHGTVDGKLDFDLDHLADGDPFDPFYRGRC
ncbi:MAG: HEAT repeat domain-containing protein [Symplocastrum torsivum CPER-KK1]|jgi:hypothetical protein|uniref:HEAT repeat domain-containing protein n=1 Tax=Symplocastrum torsivum CPER-KK1 TaxID=450513 RepID=A0A951UD49_9CYAN|nr:HEAT repeat domain-containing protein [Symplocastrum torsivum CPER-KK1]